MAYPQAFGISLLLSHSVIAATVCSPVSWDTIFAYTMLMHVSLVALVQPMDNYCSEVAQEMLQRGGDGMAQHHMLGGVTAQFTMVKSGLYGLGFLYVMMHIPMDQQACKAQILLALACLDALLLFGHLWDRVPNLQVVVNCRFTYICLMALLNAGVFVSWRDCTAVSFLPVQVADTNSPPH